MFFAISTKLGNKIYHITRFMLAPYLDKLKPIFLPKPEKCTKQGMQRVYHSRVKDVDELRERLIFVWCELDQSVVNHAID